MTGDAAIRWREGIRFSLGQELIRLNTFDPQTTVLEWLRRDAYRTGTKEGCAEGDCGACTVLVGRLIDNHLRYEAINACIQPLATLDACHLLTVEDLQRPDGTLHPVQRAMVDNHASQCGFCTPGFVMSLLALYHDPKALERWSVNDVLAGNLCRCTGYGPILKAADQMREQADTTPWPFDPDMPAKLAALDDGSHYRITGNQREFAAPKTLDTLCEHAVANPDATIIAGSTDTGLWITKQHRDLGKQIWLGGVAELRRIEEAADHIVIGAGATYSDAVDVIDAHYPDAGELLRRIGSVQIRNAGTIGGNIANGSPIGDMPPFLIAIGAELRLRHDGEVRTMPLEAFFIDYGQQDRRPGEIVEAVILPKPRPGWTFKAYKISKRFDQDISAVCAAFNVQLIDGAVADACIAFGGMAAIPKRATTTEDALRGKRWTPEMVGDVAQSLAQDFQPISDMRASADYRLGVARNLLIKCCIETSRATPLRLAGEVHEHA